MVIVFGLFCYCHSVIKSRATCRPKSRCHADLSTVSVVANRSLYQDLMHSGYRGTAVPNVCLQAFSLFPLPTPLDQRPVHRLSYSWFSQDITKIQTKKLSLLLSFYFYVILEHLKTFTQTNFRFKRVLCFAIQDA